VGIEIRDKKEILGFLENDPFLHLYSIGDLDDFFWPFTHWYGWKEGGKLAALFLLYCAEPQIPTLLALEQNNRDAAINLLESLLPDLPERFFCHASSYISRELKVQFQTSSHAPSMKMRLAREAFKLPSQPDRFEVVNLNEQDLARIHALYEKAYPENWFDPRMLATGQYLGIVQDRLLAIAGIHVYSPVYRVAALGNIATDPDCRGEGLGTYLTGQLCRQLFDTVDRIGLNVRQSNQAAIRCYRQIGFVSHCQYEELLVQNPKRSFGSPQSRESQQ
jgi:ribosomal protein S18 acetylase RimI-like enzyme